MAKNGFTFFLEESKEIGSAYMNFVNELASKSSLDQLTNDLVYISALVASKNFGGIEFHVNEARKHGATRDQIKSTILLSMPLIGMSVLEPLNIALTCYDTN
jgi:alkylhydroperoxidase/carboxymuconolactone decarboxylase family protein YurZ